MILLKENINNVDEYNYLFDEVGWGNYGVEVSKKALENTTYFVFVYDDEK